MTTAFNAQISKGFRLGGINDPLNVPLCTPEDLATFGGNDTWDDEVLWNYEVGLKTATQGGRGTFNIAAFFADISDLQATVTAGSCSSRVVFNVPEARSMGVELEYAAQLTNFFDIAISASFIDSELRSTLTSRPRSGAWHPRPRRLLDQPAPDGGRLRAHPVLADRGKTPAAETAWSLDQSFPAGFVRGRFAER